MGLTAAASGLVVVLLSLPVLQGQDGWGVTYTSTEICASKGSTVEISCHYTYPTNSRIKVIKEFWFTKQFGDVFVDLRSDPDYSNRVVYHCNGRHCTLTIKDLRESDSDMYKFRFVTNTFKGKYTGFPGVTLTVTGLQVTRSNLLLKCDSRCPVTGNPNYVWFENGEVLKNSEHYTMSNFNPAFVYSCALKGHEKFQSPPVYAPRRPSVTFNPSAEIVEGGSVTLTCSSDAKPAAKHTWSKKNRILASKEAQLVLSPVQSSDSGEYNCTAENELGRTSRRISVDVKYGPKRSSVTLHPSAEIVEGSSVTLNCSSDANPAATYTWYKNSQFLSHGQERKFISITSEDSGYYHCESQNKYGQMNSSSQLIDVQYAPRLPSVSVSPSGEVMEGSTLSFTCSSDANPAATYSWYKENEKSPKAEGKTYNITDFRVEHSGNYYCEARNKRGHHNSTSTLTAVAASPKVWKSAIIATATVLFVAFICVFVFLLIRKKRASKQSSTPGDTPDNKGKDLCNPSEAEDELHYGDVHFSKNHTEPVYANSGLAGLHRHKVEEEEVEYTSVVFESAGAAQRTKCQETLEDSDALYNTVNNYGI